MTFQQQVDNVKKGLTIFMNITTNLTFVCATYIYDLCLCSTTGYFSNNNEKNHLAFYCSHLRILLTYRITTKFDDITRYFFILFKIGKKIEIFLYQQKSIHTCQRYLSIDSCMKKETTFRVGHFTTISCHFFANYTYIFHKKEV